MTNDELNKFLHEQVMGKCWHDWHGAAKENNFSCPKCGKPRKVFQKSNPDYCSDLNAVAEVEAKVIEKVGAETYKNSLIPVVMTTGQSSGDFYITLATATAEQRARACYEAWRENR